MATSAGCNRYDLFGAAGYSQESYSNDADLLFVVDNSCSMTEESAGLAQNFDDFIQNLTRGDDGSGTDGLADAVSAYLDLAQQRERYLDFGIGITTTNVAADYGGLLGPQPIVENADDAVADAFNTNLLCHTACLDPSVIPEDPSYVCGEPAATVSKQSLDCLCGANAWQGHCTTDDEEGLEAVFMAMCRAVPDPPEACWGEISQFSDADIGSNDGLMRPGSTLIPIIVSDEGDQSRRGPSGTDDIDEYLRLYRLFNHRVRFGVIGPTLEHLGCSPAANWGAARYAHVVEATGGRLIPIATDEGGGCRDTDFAENLEQLGELLNGLLDRFPLRAVPDEASIVVYVDGSKASRAEQDADGTWTDGWAYLPEENVVAFFGAAVPDYDQSVQIYYLPLAGMPRELPF